MKRRAAEIRSSPRGAPRDAGVAGTPLRGPRAANHGPWIPACAGMNGIARRTFIALLGGAAAAWPLAAGAQQASKIWRIGILGASLNAPSMATQHQAFLAELNVLGFSEGKNFTIEYA